MLFLQYHAYAILVPPPLSVPYAGLRISDNGWCGTVSTRDRIDADNKNSFAMEVDPRCAALLATAAVTIPIHRKTIWLGPVNCPSVHMAGTEPQEHLTEYALRFQLAVQYLFNI